MWNHQGPRRRRPCHCQQPVKEIVYPVQNQVVHKCSEETVKHIHPQHTTVMNHHLIKNEHLFPHTTSVENMYEEMNVFGNRPPGANQVAGAMMPGGNQVGGAMMPGMGHGPNKSKGNCCKKGRHM